MRLKDIFPVPARELHREAGISTPFSIWIKDRIRSLNLSEEDDYLIETDVSPHNQRTMYNYFLTVEAASKITKRLHDELKRDRVLMFIRPFYTPGYQQWRMFIDCLKGRSTEYPF